MGTAGQRSKWDILAGAMLREDSARFTVIYRLLLRAARDRGDFALLGQDELGTSVFESAPGVARRMLLVGYIKPWKDS